MIKMIAAVSKNGVIGIDNTLPWAGSYPEDMKHFRTMTKNSVVIMGRKTFESVGSRPLPSRRNIVISRLANGLGVLNTEGVEVYASVKEAIDKCDGDTRDIWIVGGERIYDAGMEFADEIYLTLIPKWLDVELGQTAARFPFISPALFKCEDEFYAQLADGLNVVRYIKVK